MANRKSITARIRGFFAALTRENALASPRLKTELKNRKR